MRWGECVEGVPLPNWKIPKIYEFNFNFSSIDRIFDTIFDIISIEKVNINYVKGSKLVWVDTPVEDTGRKKCSNWDYCGRRAALGKNFCCENCSVYVNQFKKDSPWSWRAGLRMRCKRGGGTTNWNTYGTGWMPPNPFFYRLTKKSLTFRSKGCRKWTILNQNFTQNHKDCDGPPDSNKYVVENGKYSGKKMVKKQIKVSGGLTPIKKTIPGNVKLKMSSSMWPFFIHFNIYRIKRQYYVVFEIKNSIKIDLKKKLSIEEIIIIGGGGGGGGASGISSKNITGGGGGGGGGIVNYKGVELAKGNYNFIIGSGGESGGICEKNKLNSNNDKNWLVNSDGKNGSDTKIVSVKTNRTYNYLGKILEANGGAGGKNHNSQKGVYNNPPGTNKL